MSGRSYRGVLQREWSSLTLQSDLTLNTSNKNFCSWSWQMPWYCDFLTWFNSFPRACGPRDLSRSWALGDPRLLEGSIWTMAPLKQGKDQNRPAAYIHALACKKTPPLPHNQRKLNGWNFSSS